ncbi:MAG: DEAD/DEAH box helicase [Desulfoarculaceae bacterium]|nr:DEAD/DEAH box helicase [Desulfoarculaceae bacterium]
MTTVFSAKISRPSLPVLTVSSDCLLEGISLPLEKAIKERLTIDNPKYTSAKRYGRWVGKRLQPTLTYYDSVPTGLRFPRGFANQAILLCRQYGQETPRIVESRRLLAEVDFSFSGCLRPYQDLAVAEVEKRSFGVLEAGTGSGKTVMALAIIAARRQPTLIVVHTKELLYQWQQRTQEFLGRSVGLIGDGHLDIQPLTVAIVNSARKRVDELMPLFGHLVVDECHRVPAALFTDVVSRFDCHYLLGLSATAFRSDEGTTRLISIFMGDRIHQVDQAQLQATGAIVKPELVRRKTAFTHQYRGDYQALITALTSHQGRNLQIVEDVIQAAGRENAGVLLVVSDRVSHCELFAGELCRRGQSVALLTGQTPTEMRVQIVKKVQDGELRILVATLQLIGEGFDCAGLSTLFLTTPITFEGRLLQVLGRIMRPAAGKEAQVYDYVDESISVLRRSAEHRKKVLGAL